MILNEYDIVTINNKEYVIAKTKEVDKTCYYLLVRIDEEENVIANDTLIMKQSIYNNIEPDRLYPLSDEEKEKLPFSLTQEFLKEI